MSDAKVPDDFPRVAFPASVAGAQAKFGGRMIHGRFVVGLTEAERAERYAMCLDLVTQLAGYFRRKAVEPPARSQDELLNWVERGVRNKQAAWQLGGPEVDWIVEQMRQAYKTTLDRFEDLENLK